jgi:hypothetical protein
MKISNKILWMAIAGLFGCVVAFLFFLRVATSPMIEKAEPIPAITGSKQLVHRSYPLKFFSGIRASGKWVLELKKGSGSSMVQITMAGGDLTGKISGSGKVIYDGEIRHQEVRISGSGSIQRRKSAG